MSKIKNALKIASVAIPLTFGADKIFGQDTTKVDTNTVYLKPTIPYTYRFPGFPDDTTKSDLTTLTLYPDPAKDTRDTIIIKKPTKFYFSNYKEGKEPMIIAKKGDAIVITYDEFGSRKSLEVFSDAEPESADSDSVFSDEELDKIISTPVDSDTVKIKASLENAVKDTTNSTRVTTFTYPDSSKVKSKKTGVRNYLETNNPFVHNADRITLAVDGHYMDLNPNTNMGLEEIIHAKIGDKNYIACNAKIATKNVIKFIQKYPFSKDEKNIKISNYEAKLDSINKVNTLSDSVYNESAKILTKALGNNTFESIADSLYDEKGNCKIAEGWYVLLAKNKDKSETNPIYLHIRPSKNNINVRGEQGFTSHLRGENKNTNTGNTYEMNVIELDNLKSTVKEIKKQLEEVKTKEDSIGKEQKKKPHGYVNVNIQPDTSKDKDLTSLILGANAGPEMIGVSAGIKHGSVGLVLDYNFGLTENLKTIPGPESRTGMYGEAKTNYSSWRAIGGSVELGNNLFAGIGANLWNYKLEKEVIIHNSDGTVKRKTEPIESASKTSGNFYVGGKLKDKYRITGGFDTEKKFYANAGFNINLGKRK